MFVIHCPKSLKILKYLVGQPDDFRNATFGRDLQSVQTRAIVRVPQVNGTVDRAGDQQTAGRVETGRGDLDGQRLTVQLSSVCHGASGDQFAGAHVPHGDDRVRAGHGYQHVEQPVVHGLGDGRVVRIAGDVTGARRVLAAPDRHNHAGHHHYDHLVELIEQCRKPTPAVGRIGYLGRPAERVQTRRGQHVPHFDRAVCGHRVQVAVGRPVVEHVLHGLFVAHELRAPGRPAVRGGGEHVPQPHQAVHAAGGHARITDRAHAPEPVGGRHVTHRDRRADATARHRLA